VVAHAVATPTNNRDSAANALTLEFLEKVQGTITNRTGKICSKDHTSRPAASTQLENMVKIVLAKQYNGNDEYWWGAREVIQIMRAHFGRLQVPGKAKGKDPYLDLRYLQFKEEGHTQPPEFGNDRASVIRFGEAGNGKGAGHHCVPEARGRLGPSDRDRQRAVQAGVEH
jgi:hypothetical protein